MIFGLLLGGLAIGGCDCSSGTDAAKLTITSPEDDARITLAEDEDPASAGVQLTVTVEADGLDEGEEVSLFADDRTADVDPPLATTTIDADAMAIFSAVTFTSGEYRLQARTAGGGTQSNVVRIVVVDSCAEIRFVSPEPTGTGSLTLGPADDVDGEMCGETFEAEIAVSTDAGDGNEATVFVNGSSRGSTTIDGTVARFQVGLDNRGETPNTVEVEVVNEDGVACRAEFPERLLVDCEGVSCSITQPDTGTAFLNQDDDVSDVDGFQTDFVVSTDSDSPDQSVRLVIDGDTDGAPEETVTPMGSGSEALFGNVGLSEGLHRVRASCTDGAGNVTSSGLAEWTVDITACGISISDPTDGAEFNPMSDVNDAVADTQINVSGTTDGTDCTGLRVGLCSGIDGETFTSFSGGDFADEEATLSSSATQTICAEVEDEAGNVGRAEVDIMFRSDAPQLEITSPAGGTRYNRDGTDFGGDTYEADGDDTTPRCDVDFEVNCTDVGTTVELIRTDTSSVLPGGSATCTATSGLPSPYEGVATFSGVSLPNLAGGSVNVAARATAGGLTGTSDPITVFADCQAPTFSFLRPMCGARLYPAVDDEDTGTAGFQYEVRVSNTNPGPPDVTLEIRNGGTVVYTDTATTAPLGISSFPDADFGAGGDLTIEACGTDSFGNTGCTGLPCTVTVEDLPTVNITEPADGAILGAGDDCDGGAGGFQVRVQANSDAPSGSSAEVEVSGGGGTTSTTTPVDVCVDAPESPSVTITVRVTDSRGTGSGSVTVAIDATPPTDPLDDLAVGSVVDRRGGVVRLAWTAVDDVERYLLRCSDAPITNESEWDAATAKTILTTPGSAGTTQSEDIGGFRLGDEQFCMLRGEDLGGALTPLGNSVSVLLDFLQVEITAPSGAVELGRSSTPVGDVNGDGFDDVLVSGDGDAYLFFGSSTGPSTSPDVTIAGDSSEFFGTPVASIGDFSGDGIPDFAIGVSGANGFKGAVYVFFGHDSATSWDSLIDTTASGCQADLCLFAEDGASGGPDEFAFFGAGLGSAGDFNGDGVSDLAIGATFSDTVGRVYIILGSDSFTAGSNFDVPADGLAGFTIPAPSGAETFGQGLAGLGNYDGVPRDDLAISAPGGSTTSIGYSYGLSGRAYSGSGIVTIAASELVEMSSRDGGGYGTTIVSAGDFDDDGNADIAVGRGTNRGAADVLFGTGSGFIPAATLELRNPDSIATSDKFGHSLAMADHPWLGLLGDIDADGATDVITGSEQYRGTPPGAADIFYGRTSPPSQIRRQNADARLQPASSESGPVSRRPQYVGDLNGDGYPDILLGDPAQSGGSGRAIYYY